MSENAPIEPGQARPTDSLTNRIWLRMMPIEQRTLFGILFFFITLVVLAWIGVNETHRMETYTLQYEARAIQRGAGLFRDNCATCHGISGEGIPGRAPTLNRPEMFNGARLEELGYAGTVRDYVTLTISAGRPARSNPEWPQVMPTWSQDYGGPLRPDQVEDLVAFVMNWGCDYDEKCAEPGLVPAATAGPTPTPAPTPEPIDLAEFVAGLPDGDAARGEELYLGTVTLLDGKAGACNACHTADGSALVGPSFTLVNADMPAGYPSLDVYIAESIFYPNAHKVAGFEAIQMPLNFFDRFKAPDDPQGLQDMADLIAFIKSVAD